MRSKSEDMMKKIKSCIEDYALDNSGRTPTTREIGRLVGVTHVTVSRYLRAMDEAGIIEYNRGKISTDVLQKMDEVPLEPKYSDKAPAGTAEDLTDSVEEFVHIPTCFRGGMSGSFFLITVTGYSMVDAGIDPGDMLIVHRQQDVRKGNIAVALLEGHGTTIKRVCRDEEGLYLWAENESWSDENRFFGRNFEVQGVAVKVVKDL